MSRLLACAIAACFLSACTCRADPPERDAPAPETGRIDLPAAERKSGLPVEAALAQRRSVRRYASRALKLAEIGQLLWAAQGINDPGGRLRTAPSAGATFPMEIYLVCGEVEGLSAGVYHYLPASHQLERTGGRDLRGPLAETALGQSWIREAPAVLVAAAVMARTRSRYGDRTRRYVHMEAGHIAQNVHLQAESLMLGTVVVGAFDDAGVARIMGMRAGMEPVWLMPVGGR
ncbi:MAG: SagB/ThcOx family dehydrogenase [Deltaproteobacteria bacterium]|nr:SagB/ThcOx family dehydrogenase [Deltaproteobacteria bacterium]